MSWHKLYQIIMVIFLVHLIGIHHVYAMYRNVKSGLNDNHEPGSVKTESAFFKLLSFPGGLKIYQTLYDSKELDKKKCEELAGKYLSLLKEKNGYNVEENTRLANNLRQEIREAKNKNIQLPNVKSPDGKALPAKNGNLLSSASLTDFSDKERKKKESRLKEKSPTIAALKFSYDDDVSVSNEKTQPYHIDNDHELALALERSLRASVLSNGDGLVEQVKLFNQATKNGMHSQDIVEFKGMDFESGLPECICPDISEVRITESSLLELFNTNCQRHVFKDKTGALKVTLYHGTKAYLMKSYQKEGPKLSKFGSLGSAYYLTAMISKAKLYAQRTRNKQYEKWTNGASLNEKEVKPAIISYHVQCPDQLKVAAVMPGEKMNRPEPVLRNEIQPDEFAFRSEAVTQISCNQIWILD